MNRNDQIRFSGNIATGILGTLVPYHLVFCHKKQENRYVVAVVSYQLSVISKSISILIYLP